MKVLHVTASLKGGAGIAALRSVEALRAAGVDVQLLTAEELGGGGKWRARRDKLPLLAYPQRKIFSTWSTGWWPGRVAERINAVGADVVHLHWVGHGFLGLSEMREIRAPLVWSLHDLWVVTGGCHYPGECVRFMKECGACPQLGSADEGDLSRWNHRRKKQYIVEPVRRWIAPSEWIAGVAGRIGGLPAERLRVIRNTLDLDVFHPSRRSAARVQAGIAGDALVLAVGSFELDEPRKGNHLLTQILATWRSAHGEGEVRLVIFGAKSLPKIESAGVVIEQAGELQSAEEVADVLAAADVFVLPSLQDNLPNVAVEAQACGCAVAGFDAGGLGEIIDPGVTGVLAKARTAEALGQALAEFTLLGAERRREVSVACRARAEKLYDAKCHAETLMRLYREVVA